MLSLSSHEFAVTSRYPRAVVLSRPCIFGWSAGRFECHSVHAPSDALGQILIGTHREQQREREADDSAHRPVPTGERCHAVSRISRSFAVALSRCAVPVHAKPSARCLILHTQASAYRLKAVILLPRGVSFQSIPPKASWQRLDFADLNRGQCRQCAHDDGAY